jgi:outer membrane protein OmpU
MKKVLFATTALIATAGVASADITLTGGAVAGYKNAGNDTGRAHTELDFNIVASGTSDNGISFGASMDIDGDTTYTTGGSSMDENAGDMEVFVSGEFGTLTFGAVDHMTDTGVSDMGFDGIDIDGLGQADKLIGSSVLTADINYSYSMNGVTIGATYDTVTDDRSVGITYSANGLSLTYAQSEDSATEDTASIIVAKYTTGAIGLQASVTNMGDQSTPANDTQGTALFASYAVDSNLTIMAGYSQNDEAAAADTTAQGIGFSYNMGGGGTLSGAAGDRNNETVWDLGLTMSF